MYVKMAMLCLSDRKISKAENYKNKFISLWSTEYLGFVNINVIELFFRDLALHYFKAYKNSAALKTVNEGIVILPSSWNLKNLKKDISN